MKKFIEKNGIFEIEIPITWKYSLMNDRIHTFNEYDVWKPDVFQISINELDIQEKKINFLKKFENFPIIKINENEFIQLPDSIDNKFTVKSWIKNINNKGIVFSFTYENFTNPELDSRTTEEKLTAVNKIIDSFKLIDNTERISKLNIYRFEMFLQGVSATAAMLENAIKNKSFIEATCILASQIDALLRIGIVLQTQINNKNSEIDNEWIYQGTEDRKKSEKDIYKKSLDIGIISHKQFDELYKLYEDRNRVIHRFIISEITLAEVENISYNYYQQQQQINEIIYKIESEQIRLNVGITILAEKGDNINHLDHMRGKIGKQNYFDET